MSEFTREPMPPADCSRLSSMDLAWVDVFSRSTMSLPCYLRNSLYGVSSASCFFVFLCKAFLFMRSINVEDKDHLNFYNLTRGPGVRVFTNGPGDLGSIPGRVIPKTQKMILDASLLNTQHYKVRIKGKVEQSRERSSALPYYRKGSLRVTLD